MNPRYLALLAALLLLAAPQTRAASKRDARGEIVYQDEQGVIRYVADDSEVAVFGANYCLPSACDYRAAHRVAPTLEEKKAMIDEDMAHFARMGFRALRLSFWGDWENSDQEGNLLDNEHLELLDYLIYRASQRDILMLFSPTVVHAAWWPEGPVPMPGFSARYPKAEMTFDKKAIAAQQNYMMQFLEYRNRYTGCRYKEEPCIIAIELLNEPARIDGRNDEIREYIDAMTLAIRRTGCRKITAYNISENFNTAPAIRQSMIDCVLYGWYPTQLNHGAALCGNMLPYVDDYGPMKIETGARSRMVYEFDSPDLTVSYMYPAQAREFREGGVQFAAMFSYDMLRTAQFNLGWQTHLLNMVYTPRKAVSAMIAVKVMERLERGADTGRYPENMKFAGVELNPDKDRSIYFDGETLYHTSPAEDGPVTDRRLKRIAATGSSTAVKYDGTGIYFIDKIDEGVWRIETYPDVIQLADPFAPLDFDRRVRVFALNHRMHRMKLCIDDLGEEFTITPLVGETPQQSVSDGSFSVAEGVCIVSRREDYVLPERIGRTGISEYHAAIDRRTADEYLTIFDARTDGAELLYTRGGFYSPVYDNRPSESGAMRLYCSELTDKPEYRFPADISAQMHLQRRTAAHAAAGLVPRAVRIKARALTPSTDRMTIVFNAEGGAASAAEVMLGQQWSMITVPLADFRPDRAPQLPQDWPGIAPYYRTDFGCGGADFTAEDFDLAKIENIYFSMRSSSYPDAGAGPKGIEVESAELVF